MNTTTKKVFYLFSPFGKKVQIYYDADQVFEHNLFKSLSQKTVPIYYTQIRTNPAFCFLFNWILKKQIDVPNENVFLIYKGYDSVLFFYENLGKIRVIRKQNGRYQEENFLGYPIFFDFSLEHIPNKKILQKVLNEHWLNLKKDSKIIHGDFTYNNILINSDQEISFIDKKNVETGTPIITDHFYFYAYFLIRLNLFCRGNKAHTDSLTKELHNIYAEIFKNENPAILTDIQNLKLANFNISNNKDLFFFWKNNFFSFIKKILS